MQTPEPRSQCTQRSPPAPTALSGWSTDRGRELSPAHLERIFEKFFRADEARASSAGGAGLGLAIAREIARAHGGDIYAASDAGLTSFTIWIPQGPSVAVRAPSAS